MAHKIEPGGAGSDTDAIHDNVAAEINGLTEKATPVSGDLLVVEDSADSNNKKKVQVGNLPGGSGTDADAIHDNVAAEISAITAKATPTTADYLILEDAAAADAKKSATIGDVVTPAIVGNTTAQWNADQLQGVDVDGTSSPADGQVLTYDGTGTQWTPASPAEGTSYLEMGENHTITSAGGSPDSEDVGIGIFDASLHNAVTFRAMLESTFATTGTSTIRLYDEGSLSTPGSSRLVCSFSQTTDTAYEVFEQALTIVTSGASTNEILAEGRVYRVQIDITATSSDTCYVGTAGFFATGNADVVVVSADAVQAIAMSLNA